MKIKQLLMLCSLGISTIGYSLDPSFPQGCQSVGFQFEEALLLLQPQSEESPQTLYLLHNLASYPIRLKIKRSIPQIYLPHFRNTIQSGEWGLFALNKSQMYFTCSASYNYLTTAEESQFNTLDKPDPQEDDDESLLVSNQVSCSEVLELCQYTRAKFSDINQGNYWLKNTKSMQAAIHEAIETGILLRW